MADPQPALSPAQRNHLKKHLDGDYPQGGGYVEFSDILPSPGAICAEANPPVSIVPIPDEPGRIHIPKKVDIIDEDKVRFIADTAIYADPKAARDCLEQYAKHFRAKHQFKRLLVGTTASASNKDTRFELSRKLAEAIRDTLYDLGVAPHQIRTVGLADTDTWHVNDLGADGRLVEEYARLNRKVMLLEPNSPEAQTIMDSTGINSF